MLKIKQKLRAILLTGACLTAVAGGTFAFTGSAQATTDYRHMSHVWFDLSDDGPSGNERIRYSTFLDSLRSAASEQPTGLYATQQGPYGLVQVSLSAPNAQGGRNRVDVWVNPNNLYVWGFSNQAGTTWQFNDINGALGARMAETTTPRPPVNTNVQTLNFGSNYNSLRGVAGRGRESMPISWHDMQASIARLGTVTDPYNSERQNVARALSAIIQFTAEAARFNDVEGTFRAAMNSWDVQQGLPIQQQYLENNWDALSRTYWNSTRGPSQQVDIPTIGTVSGTQGVARYVRTLLQDTSLIDTNGNWDRTEL